MFHLINFQLPLIFSLLIVLVAAKILGEVAERFGQPSMIGEVVAGMILGPSLLNVIQNTAELKVLAELGVFLLIVMAGLEIELSEMLGRPVDLRTAEDLSQYFRDEVLEEAVLQYVRVA